MVAFLVLITSSLQAVEILPVDQLRPGMKGVSLTVLQGTKVEAIETEILGVQKGALGPGRDLIIGRLTDPRTALSGAVHGMSGSPLMVDGKLVGALSRRIMLFEKDGHCGFTPAADMFDVERRPASKEPPLPWRSGQWVKADRGGAFDFRTPPPGDLLGLPLALPRWDEASARIFGPLLGSTPGLVPLAARSAPRAEGAGRIPLEAGSALSVVLMDGDIHIAGTGTLTWREGDRFMGFGHPMLGLGETALPVSPAEIISIIPSYLRPFKLSNSAAAEGTMLQDRLSAVSGVLGKLPAMGTYTIARRHNREERPTLRGRFARHPELTPMLIAMAVREVLMDEQDVSLDATLVLRGEVKLKGLPGYRMDGVYSGEFNERMQALFDQIFPLLRLTQAFPKQVEIESLDLSVESYERASQWEVVALHPRQAVARPGERVEVAVRLRNPLGRERTVVLAAEVPEEVRGGPVGLRVLGGSDLRQESRMETMFSETSTPEALLRGQEVRPADRLYLQVFTLGPGTAAEGWRQPGLPATVARLASSLGGARVLREVHAESSAPLDGVLRGAAETSLPIELP